LPPPRRCAAHLALAVALLLGMAGCQSGAPASASPKPRLAADGASTAPISVRPTATPARLAQTPDATAAVSAPAVPAAATATQPVSTSAALIHLLFTGDINPGRCPAQIALAHNDFTLPYQIVGDALRSADIAVGSLDGAISDLSPPSPCPQTMNLIGPARTVEGLRYAGFDVITVATNHAKDCGRLGWNCSDRAFHDTLSNLRAAGILPVGGGENLAAALAPVIVERQGVRFAFIGVTEVGPNTFAGPTQPGTAPLSDESFPAVLAAIGAARLIADVVIVLPQWGVEYAETPSAGQLRWAGLMIDAGATLVIGNQSHVVQPVEVFAAADGSGARGVVAYELGNFVFDQGPWRTRQGMLFEATFEGRRLAGWRLRPIHILSLYQPAWPDEAEAQAILSRVETASAALPNR
jgi:poly-gamma-glutamate synthesis protein (capsule biosynthesis protein)